MSKWDRRFIEMAKTAAGWSKDPSTRVGAVIADSKNRIVSVGFNGPPCGTNDVAILANRDEKLRRTIHAEANAILFAGRDLAGCTIYTTHPPCANCAALIVQSGISRVVAPMPDAEFATRWADGILSAISMFAEADVTFEELLP